MFSLLSRRPCKTSVSPNIPAPSGLNKMKTFSPRDEILQKKNETKSGIFKMKTTEETRPIMIEIETSKFQENNMKSTMPVY
jgi:hypothetical protein